MKNKIKPDMAQEKVIPEMSRDDIIQLLIETRDLPSKSLPSEFVDLKERIAIAIKSKDNLHPKILNFAKEMQKQLDINSAMGKDTWESWFNFQQILCDLEYHKAKMLMALKEDNMGAFREYLADCGNCLMFLGNACGLYGFYEDTKPVFHMVSPLFTETTLAEAVMMAEKTGQLKGDSNHG